jgi:Uma2 family endonuclease
VLADDTLLQPDLVVARRSELTERNLPAAPVLAIEVLSPSTHGIDLLLKRERLQRAGCPFYWVIDPELPSITALRLDTDGYQQTAHVVGSARFETTEPYQVGFAAAELTRP